MVLKVVLTNMSKRFYLVFNPGDKDKNGKSLMNKYDTVFADNIKEAEHMGKSKYGKFITVTEDFSFVRKFNMSHI